MDRTPSIVVVVEIGKIQLQWTFVFFWKPTFVPFFCEQFYILSIVTLKAMAERKYSLKRE